MTASDFAEVFGSLVGMYFIGWAMGYSLLIFKQLAEKI